MKFHQFAEYLLQEVDNFSACRSVMRLTHLSRSVSLSGTWPVKELPSSLWQKSRFRKSHPSGAKALLIMLALRHD